MLGVFFYFGVVWTGCMFVCLFVCFCIFPCHSSPCLPRAGLFYLTPQMSNSLGIERDCYFKINLVIVSFLQGAVNQFRNLDNLVGKKKTKGKMNLLMPYPHRLFQV